MSYKRVVKKKGKSYGPYVYESYRDKDGKVQKRYLGKFEEKKRTSIPFVFVIGISLLLFLMGISYTTDILVNDGKISKSTNKLFLESFGKLTGLVMENSGDEFVDGESEDEESEEDGVEEDLNDSVEDGEENETLVENRLDETNGSEDGEIPGEFNESLEDLNGTSDPESSLGGEDILNGTIGEEIENNESIGITFPVNLTNNTLIDFNVIVLI